MQRSQGMEERVTSAVREFVVSMASGSKVVADMKALTEVTSALPQSGFDYWERLIRSEFTSAERRVTHPVWSASPRTRELLTWLDLTSWDGYRRERTLRTLSGAAPNAFFFSLALRRLNDWVPQVRKAAREKLPELAQATDPQCVADALCTALCNWSSWGRIEQEDQKTIYQLIDQDSIAAAIRSKLMTSPFGPMASLFSQLGRTTILDDSIDEIARLAVQPSVRAKAYRSLFEGRIAWSEGRKWEWTSKRYCEGRLVPVVAERKIEVGVSLLELLQRSAQDRSSIVRRVSAEFLIRELPHLGDVAYGLAQRFASDPSHPVAERGRFALKTLEQQTQT